MIKAKQNIEGIFFIVYEQDITNAKRIRRPMQKGDCCKSIWLQLPYVTLFGEKACESKNLPQ